MGSILGIDVGMDMPKVFSEKFGGGLTIIVAALIFFIAIAIGIYIYIQYKTYNKKIVLFENLAGQGYQVTFKDRARVVKIGDGGEEILYLKKKKVYRTAYGKKMGRNTYWFAVGQDGYWYNILLGDLDAKMGMLDIEPVDRDMRYMHVAIRKNIQERYRKVGFMEKYGVLMMSGIFILAMIISLFILIDQIGQLMGEAKQTVEAANELQEPISNMLSKIDTICSGGSGIIPAEP